MIQKYDGLFIQPMKPFAALPNLVNPYLKGIVSRDWKGLQMVLLDRFEV
jgi:hypothetical protein